MADTLQADVVRATREFNRFYAPLMGALAKDYLHTPFNLQEARVVYEVAKGPGRTAKEIQRATGFDQGYLSRIANRLQVQGIVKASRSGHDRRHRPLFLTAKGRRAFRALDRRADQQAATLVRTLGPQEQERLTDAFTQVRELLGSGTSPTSFTVRRQRVGDLGWTFYRQAVVYRQEFGYNDVFEKYLSQGLAPFLESFDDGKDRLWVAERLGRRLGFVAIQHAPDRPGWAKLRWFLVEREARGKGVGTALIERAIRFSRGAGYSGIFLWTVDDLADARRVYERHGFELAEEKPGCEWASWGKEQRWELRLSRPARKGRPSRPTAAGTLGS